MAQPQLQAQFFVRPDGVAIPKAPPLPARVRHFIHKRDGGVCVLCGIRVALFGNTVSPFRPPPGAVDHILARARGGQNDLVNLRLLCITCNAQKGAQ